MKLELEMVERSPRINISLADGIVSKLERYARSRGSKSATEASYLLTRILDDLEAQGQIPPDAETEDGEAIRSKRFVRALVLGEAIESADIAKLANDLGVEPERLTAYLKKQTRKSAQ